MAVCVCVQETVSRTGSALSNTALLSELLKQIVGVRKREKMTRSRALTKACTLYRGCEDVSVNADGMLLSCAHSTLGMLNCKC